MKCSKCGEECRENQAFCLKCGNPIQVVPDFNLIEAELANNIGELLDEDKRNEVVKEEFVEFSDMSTKKIDKDLAMDLKLVNIRRELDDVELERKEPEPDKVVFSGNKVDSNTTKIKEATIQLDKENEEQEKKENKKRRLIIMSSISVAIIIVIVIGAIFAIDFLSDKNNYNKATFTSSYDKAVEYVGEREYDKAVEQIEVAIEKAQNVDEKVKARLYLDTIYAFMTGVEDKIIENLTELTILCPSEVKYFQSVAKYYMERKEYEKLSQFVTSVENEDVYEALSEYTVKLPVSDKESGSYPAFMEIVLSCEDNCAVYYTIHKVNSFDDNTKYSAPTTGDLLYKNGISFEQEGIYIIQAVAVNELGIKSKIAEYRYEIALVAPSEPVMTPTSGQYSEQTLITITAPEGSTIYYTIDDENISTESTLYTEPFKMPLGSHIVRAIAIDKNGLQSSITETAYNLNLSKNYSIQQAKSGLVQKLIEDGVVMSDAMLTLDGGEVTITYKESKNIDNFGFYIFTIAIYDIDDVNIGEMYYGYEYNIGGAYKIDVVEGQYMLVGEVVVPNEGETTSSAN